MQKKITEKTISKIRLMERVAIYLKSGYRVSEIAEKLDYAHSYISAIKKLIYSL
jgi:hypothetical protein